MCVFLFIVLFFIGIISGAANNVFHSYDSGNIALAVKDYNIAEDRPHLPGYFLYVMLIRFVNFFTGSTHLSVILLQNFFSASGLALLYLLLKHFNDRKTSLIITVFIATNPLVRFYAGTTEIYSFDLLFSVLLVLVGISRKYIFVLPLIFAVGAGIRQSSALILLPLYFYFWYDFLKKTKNYKLFALSNLTGLAIFFIWFIAMTNSAGGLDKFFGLIEKQNPVPPVSIIKNIAQMLITGIWFIVPFFIVLLLGKITKTDIGINKKLGNIIILWILPAVIVFAFVHYTRGYWLIAIGGIALWLAVVSKPRLLWYILIFFILLQSAYFVFMPYKLNTAEIFYLPTQRHISTIETAYHRMLSVNSLSLSHLRYIDYTTKKIISEADNIKKCKYILLDPSLPLYARALQAGYERRFLFAELNLVRPDGYFLYKDMKQLNLAGRRQLIDSSLIVGITPFVSNINPKYIRIIRKDSLITFYLARKDKIYELKQIYNKYFQKR